MADIFYDTCSLLFLQKDIFKEPFYISSITLNELEGIKNSATKDEETKWAARQVLHLLKENEDKYEVVVYKETDKYIITLYDLPQTNDSKIIASTYKTFSNGTGVFITNDLACYHIAKSIGMNTKLISEEIQDDYTGFKEIQLDDEELATFYNNSYANNENIFTLLENEYLIIKDNKGEIIDKYKWFNDKYISVPYIKLDSKMFGKIAPLNKDIYQQCALDSLMNNQITMLRGPAGSGKSWLSCGYLFTLLEKGDIDRIIIFANTVATKGSAKLGYYPGSRTEKLLDSQIGNFLISKIGDRVGVERLIDDGVLMLLPLSDIRGFDTSGMNAGIYITEAQNLDIELIRLALQRIGNDSICILDGDFEHQVDMSIYAGSRNGMRRVSEVFRGSDIYGEVKLQKIHRSKIAEIAERL